MKLGVNKVENCGMDVDQSRSNFRVEQFLLRNKMYLTHVKIVNNKRKQKSTFASRILMLQTWTISTTCFPQTNYIVMRTKHKLEWFMQFCNLCLLFIMTVMRSHMPRINGIMQHHLYISSIWGEKKLHKK